MNDYRIHERQSGEVFYVSAESVELAALQAAKQLNKSKRGVFARRATGDPGKSGVFQGYKDLRGEAMASSCGRPFHVSVDNST